MRGRLKFAAQDWKDWALSVVGSMRHKGDQRVTRLYEIFFGLFRRRG